MLSILAHEAQGELQKLTKSQMQALMRAYHTTDGEMLQRWPNVLQAGSLKAEVQAALLPSHNNAARQQAFALRPR